MKEIFWKEKSSWKNLHEENFLEREYFWKKIFSKEIFAKKIFSKDIFSKEILENWQILERNLFTRIFLKNFSNLICKPNQTCCHCALVIYRFCSFLETLNEAFGTDNKLSSPLSINHCCCMQLQCTSEQQKDGNSISASFLGQK